MKHFSFRWSFDAIAALLLLLLFGLFLLSLKNPTSLDDGLRHFAMAVQMRERGIFAVPGWSIFFYEGYLHNHIVDPWFLSDVLLIPFTWLGLTRGLQLFVVCEIACLMTAFLLILRSLQLSVRERILFLLVLLFGDTQFMGRFLLGRPYALMTAMMLFVLWAILERRFFLLAVFLALSVLLSQLFVFGLFLCACALVAFLYTKKFKEAATLSISTVSGILAGILLHPKPVAYLQYLVTVFLKIPFLQSIGLSREMRSGITGTSCVGVLIVIGLGILHAKQVQKVRGTERLLSHTTLHILTVAAGVLSLAFIVWVRAIDVLWPILLLWVACLYALDRSSLRMLTHLVLPARPHVQKVLSYCLIIGCAAQILSIPVIFIRDDASHTLSSYAPLRILPTNARVLDLDWDQFFAYVALRPDLQYAAGIDRSFTYLTDPNVSNAIYALERGSAGRKPLPDSRQALSIILNAYPSDYLVLSHKKFAVVIEALQKDVSFEKIAENTEIAIYAVPDWYRPQRH